MTSTQRPILTLSAAAACALLFAACALLAPPVEAQDDGLNTAGEPDEGARMTAADMEDPQTHDRMLSEDQLSATIRAILLMDEDGPEAFGTGGHPFTTKRASSASGITPVNTFPWRATGKLFQRFGNQTFVCTASVIRKSLLVTAAHCVHNYGQRRDGFADAITFEPARHEADRPFGTWTARQWWIPTVYFNGTDTCTVPGVVCENDVAVVVLNEREGQAIGDVVGMYGFPRRPDFGYVDFLGRTAAQITQLGYPSDNYDGDKMIRTDSLGYQDTPSNVIIGSAQTGGSSGGPWLMNFGIDTSFRGTPATDDTANQVVATTSWGFVSDEVKIQGASRFARNTTYTTITNIQSLVNAACSANPGAC